MWLKQLEKISNLLFILSERLNRFVRNRDNLASDLKIQKLGNNPAPTSSSDLKRLTRGIIVTTFSGRFYSDCLPLIHEIRNSGVEEPIYCVINGDWSGQFDRDLRQSFLQSIGQIKSCFPVCLGSPHGMSSLWNTGIRSCNSDLTIVLSDDLTVRQSGVKNAINTLFEQVQVHGLVTLNGSFGHFAISRDCLRAIGWFDERFVAFGEEDGDYVWRYHNHFEHAHVNLNIPSLHNYVSEVGFDVFTNRPKMKWSLFNTVFLHKKYQFGSGSVQGLFGQPAQKLLDEINNYPLDEWRDLMIPVSTMPEQTEMENIISQNLSKNSV